jgi:hypothetical protein
MAQNGEAAIGDIIEAETYAGSGQFFKFAEVRKIPPPSITGEVGDRTHMESPQATKEKTVLLLDPGNHQLEVNHLPGNATEVFVTQWTVSRQFRATRITTKNGYRYDYLAYAASQTATADVGAERVSTITLEVSGPITPSRVA